MLSLQGKRCIITGGSRGIGLAIARLFASEGASCVLTGRHKESLETAVRSLPKPSQPIGQPRPHGSYEFDVSSLKGWKALKLGLRKEHIDILVNAAGISQNSLLSKIDFDEIDHVLDVNLKGTILGCRMIIHKMMKQKSGLTRSLALELGRFNVRANVIQPGYIQTDMTKVMDEDGDLSALIPMGRLGLAEEVAEAALFLANNSYAHNCVLNIDGGLSAT
ncbi:hypothetical protein GQX73_g8783 [Xylaria multiplex]|uniref:Ketoreductase (KR) domain-containing protein n=1 Tax=Xylaria multiplex TaxID=323545 RepID=A0A7C8MMF1_9PEZI|nr:hypothetical protein GQX73_g8783 [Xylaria multiplex]